MADTGAGGNGGERASTPMEELKSKVAKAENALDEARAEKQLFLDELTALKHSLADIDKAPSDSAGAGGVDNTKEVKAQITAATVTFNKAQDAVTAATQRLAAFEQEFRESQQRDGESSVGGKRIKFYVDKSNTFGELDIVLKVKVIKGQQDLKEFLLRKGAGGLMAESDTDLVVDQFDELVDGDCYYLDSDNTTLKQMQSWVQKHSTAQEAEIQECVIRDAVVEFGELVPIADKDRILREDNRDVMELDGVLLNSMAALVIEAKHSVEPKSIGKVLKRVTDLRDRLHKHEQFKGIDKVIPVLGANHFPAAVRENCLKKGIYVVYPNGGAYCMRSPQKGMGSHQYHTLSRAVAFVNRFLHRTIR